MDFLLAALGEIAAEIFASVAHLLNLDVDIIFVDTTSTYWEVEIADELAELDDDPVDDCAGTPAERGTRTFGKSKDHRDDLPQVVIAMAVTRDGIPVRCWTFPGSESDQRIIRTVKDDLGAWNLRRMVWVVDRGFASAANRAYLQRGGGHYIHAEKLRHTNTEAAAALARPGRFREVAGNLRVKEVWVSPGGGADDGARTERFVICHNPEAAARDAAVRERLAEHLQHLIEGSDAWPKTRRDELVGSLRDKPGLRRYLRRTKTGLLRIDRRTVAREAHLDGKWLLRTSDPTLTPADLAAAYKQLIAVERGWRDCKGALGGRPDSHCNFGDRSIRACRATAATQRKSRKRAVPCHGAVRHPRPGQANPADVTGQSATGVDGPRTTAAAIGRAGDDERGRGLRVEVFLGLEFRGYFADIRVAEVSPSNHGLVAKTHHSTSRELSVTRGQVWPKCGHGGPRSGL